MAEDKQHEKQNEKDMKKEYEKMRQKYALPSYEELDVHFMLGSLEQTEFVLRTVLGKLAEKCDYARKILGNLVQPDSHLADMHEAESLGDSEKKKVMYLFNRLSYYEKEFMIRDFDYNEQLDAELIKKFTKDWIEMKSDLLKILSLLRDAWKESFVSKKGPESYFG